MIAGSLFSPIQCELTHKVGLEVGMRNFRHKKPCKNRVLSSIYGGEAGIRTLGGDQPSTVFKTAAFGRSATSPQE
jgi:hypothetical protein